MPLAPGSKVGDYEIVREIGQGGMGRVYLARDEALDRPVAIKTISSKHDDIEELTHRFQLEARAAAKLIHPNIVQIHKVDIDHDPPYMAMEYVDGQTVEQLVLGSGRLSWQRALNVVSQVASALAAAHAQGIVHRDVKLGNIMIDAAGRAKVTDFGLAKLVDSNLRLTRDSRAIGSPCYMSPEQCGIGEVGPASDIFSLGIAAFEMMTGRLPFEADSAFEMMRKITTERIPSLRAIRPEIPVVVEELVEFMAERRLEFRYPTAAELVEDLRALRARQPLTHLESLKAKAGEGGSRDDAPGSESRPRRNVTLIPPMPGPAETASVVELTGIDVAESAFRRPPQMLESPSGAPIRRMLFVGVSLALVIAAGVGAALVVLRFNAPQPPGSAQGGFTAGQGVTESPNASGQAPPPPAAGRYPRGLHPEIPPPEHTRERVVWDQFYGPGGKFEGRRDDLTDAEIAELPRDIEIGPIPIR